MMSNRLVVAVACLACTLAPGALGAARQDADALAATYRNCVEHLRGGEQDTAVRQLLAIPDLRLDKVFGRVRAAIAKSDPAFETVDIQAAILLPCGRRTS